MKDFTTLKKPKAEPNAEEFHLRKISASQLFKLCSKDETEEFSHSFDPYNYLQRTCSQPNLPQRETLKSNNLNLWRPSFGRKSETIGRRQNKTPRKYPRDYYMRQLRTESETGCLSHNNRQRYSDQNFENLYELIQKKLKTYEKAESISSESIDVHPNFDSDVFLQEGWDESIKKLAECGRLDSDLLEAIYLLRNAHKHGFFKDKIPNKEIADTASESDSFVSTDDVSSSSSFGSTVLPASTLYSSCEEETPVNSSAASSGRSTPSVVRRPRRPDIKLSNYNRNYEDYIEICRPESICSHDNEYNGSVTSETCFDIPHDIIAQAVLKSQFPKPNDGDEGLHEFERTLRRNSSELEIDPSKIEMLCIERPGSPTTDFLKQLLTNKEDIVNELHIKLSPLLHRLQKLEADSKKLSSLQVKVAVLREEKRELSALLEQKRQPQVIQNQQQYKHVGVQKNYETPISHKETSTTEVARDSVGIGDNIADIQHKNTGTQHQVEAMEVSCQKHFETLVSHKETLTEKIIRDSVGIGDNIADIQYNNMATQHCIEALEASCQNNISLSDCDVGTCTFSPKYVDLSIGDELANIPVDDKSTQLVPSNISTATQSDTPQVNIQELMVGTSLSFLTDTGVGDNCAVIEHNNQETQSCHSTVVSRSTQKAVLSSNQSISAGCSFSEVSHKSVQCWTDYQDFCCGDGQAEILSHHIGINATKTLSNASTSMETLTFSDVMVGCDISAETISFACGDNDVNEVVCDRCSALSTVSVSVGCYLNDGVCSVFDKLCECVKPETKTIGIGLHGVNDVCCDRCENLQVTTVGVGDSKINDLLCDRCSTLETHTRGVGEDTIDELNCDTCTYKGKLVDVAVGNALTKSYTSIGVGDENVNETSCDTCKQSNEENLFNFDLNIINRPSSHQQQAVLCHYCGNKVGLDDNHLEESLQAMRESMQSVSCGMKRSTASKSLNLELDNDESGYSNHQKTKIGSLDSPMSDDYAAALSDEDEEDNTESGRNDVIEACKMLHQHFSGEKPLKQQQMLKYMGIIQTLWFQTVNRRRANASVVKSYMDLFQQRIPELMETIINLTDDEGNTSLHYAITYKNYGVVSILLDSGECALNLVNQAGYSPIMLAALTGFEKKNDKYIMQRLFRMGDINKESADTGQTPLMLAVSRGNLGTVELLLDVGCDINATDDEGSTALMCACEHGNINIVKSLLGNPECDATIEDNEGSTALSIAMDSRRKDLALLIYGSLNFDTRGRIKLSPSKQSLLGLGRRSPSPVIGRR